MFKRIVLMLVLVATLSLFTAQPSFSKLRSCPPPQDTCSDCPDGWHYDAAKNQCVQDAPVEVEPKDVKPATPSNNPDLWDECWFWIKIGGDIYNACRDRE